MDKIKKKTYSLLRKSERYTKTDMVYLAKGGFWTILCQIIASISIFLLSIVYANFLPPEVYGNLKYVIAAVGIISAFSLTGISTTIIQRLGRGSDLHLFRFFKLNLLWNTPASLISLIGSVYYLIKDNQILGISFLITALLIPLISSSGIYQPYLNGKKDFKLRSILSSSSSILIALVMALISFTNNSPLVLIIGYYSSIALIQTTLFLITYSRYKKDQVIKEKNEENRSDKFAKHLSLIKLLGVIAERIDQIIIFTFLGGTQLAIYAFSIAIPKQILAVFKNIRTLALPKFSANQELKGNMVIRKSLQILFISIPIFIIYFFSAPYIFELIFPKYIDSIPISQLLGLMIVFSAAALPETLLDSKEELKKKYFLNISTNIIKIVLMVSLVVPFGLWGVAIGRVLGKAITYFISFAVIKNI